MLAAVFADRLERWGCGTETRGHRGRRAASRRPGGRREARQKARGHGRRARARRPPPRRFVGRQAPRGFREPRQGAHGRALSASRTCSTATRRRRTKALRRQLEREARDLRARIAELAREDRDAQAAPQRRPRGVAEPPRFRKAVRSSGPASSTTSPSSRQQRTIFRRRCPTWATILRGLASDARREPRRLRRRALPQENRAVAELMKKVGDIEGDERALERKPRGSAEKQEAETEERMGASSTNPKRQNEKLEKLKQRLGRGEERRPESALAEEVERARESAKQVPRLLGERDLAEAKQEADRAVANLERMEHLDEIAGRAGRATPAGGRAAGHGSRRARRRGWPRDRRDIENEVEPPEPLTSGRARGGAGAGRAAGRHRRPHRGAPPAMRPASSARCRASKTPTKSSKAAASGCASGGEAAGHEAGPRQPPNARRDGWRSCGTDAGAVGAAPRAPSRAHPRRRRIAAPRAWRQELLDAMKERRPSASATTCAATIRSSSSDGRDLTARRALAGAPGRVAPDERGRSRRLPSALFFRRSGDAADEPSTVAARAGGRTRVPDVRSPPATETATLGGYEKFLRATTPTRSRSRGRSRALPPPTTNVKALRRSPTRRRRHQGAPGGALGRTSSSAIRPRTPSWCPTRSRRSSRPTRRWRRPGLRRQTAGARRVR